MIDRIQFVISSYDRPQLLPGLVSQLVNQTCPDWHMHILQDGPNTNVNKVLDPYLTQYSTQISYVEKPHRGFWGFPNRQEFIQELDENNGRWLLLSNDDNYYAPVFVEYMLRDVRGREDIGLVACNFITRFRNWNVIAAYPRFDQILLGTFMVRLDYAKRVLFRDVKDIFSDSLWAEDLYSLMQSEGKHFMNVNHVLFVHN